MRDVYLYHFEKILASYVIGNTFHPVYEMGNNTCR